MQRKKIKRLIIHPGPPKTGSTTIQVALQKNIHLLIKQNIYFFSHHQIHPNQITFMRSIMYPSNPVGREFFLDYIQSLHENSTLIVSYEGLFVPPDYIRCIKDYFETYIDYEQISVIWYFRRQDLTMVSNFVQQFKNLAHCHEHYFSFDYAIIPKSHIFIEVFGIENCILRCFDAQYFYNNDLVEDFCHHVGIDTQGFEYAPIENQALGRQAIAIMKYVHNVFVRYHIHDIGELETLEFRKRVTEFQNFLDIKNDEKYVPSESEAREYYEKHGYRKKNAEFIKRYNLPWQVSDDFSMYPKVPQTTISTGEMNTLFDTWFYTFVEQIYTVEDYSIMEKFVEKENVPEKDVLILLLVMPHNLHYGIREGLMRILLDRRKEKGDEPLRASKVIIGIKRFFKKN